MEDLKLHKNEAGTLRFFNRFDPVPMRRRPEYPSEFRSI